MTDDLRTQIRRALAEADGFNFDSLEPHDYQRPAGKVLALVQPIADERDRLAAELERRPLLTCGASMATGTGNPAGPCTLRYNHDGPVHQDATGCSWWETTAFAVNTTREQR